MLSSYNPLMAKSKFLGPCYILTSSLPGRQEQISVQGPVCRDECVVELRDGGLDDLLKRFVLLTRHLNEMDEKETERIRR